MQILLLVPPIKRWRPVGGNAGYIMKVELYIQAENILGEGPLWNYVNRKLLWCNIENRVLLITTARNGLNAEQQKEYPLSGGFFLC